MNDVSQIFFDLYASLTIEFFVDGENSDQMTSAVRNHLECLATSLGIIPDKRSLQLWEGDKQMIRFPTHKHYSMVLTVTIDSATHSDVLIIERTLRSVTEYWNECLFRGNFKEAFVSVGLYEKGKRP